MSSPRLLVLLGVIALFATPVWAQDDEDRGPEPLNGTPIGEDDEIAESFERFEQRHIPRGEWSRLADYYQKRIENKEQGLFGLDGERYVPLYVFCHQRVGQLAPPGLAAYRRAVDAEATRLFDDARRTARVEPLEQLLRNYFCSSLGDDALLLSAVFYMERGRFHEALSVLRQMHPSLGQSVLHYPDCKVDLDGVRARMAYCLAALGETAGLDDLFDSWDPGNYWGAKRGEAFVDELTALARSAAPTERRAVDWPTIYGNSAHTNSSGFDQQIVAPRMWQTQVLPRCPLFTGNFARSWKPFEVPTNQVVVQGDRIYRLKRGSVEALSIYNGLQEWEAPLDDGVDVGGGRSSFYQQLPSPQIIRNWRYRADPAAGSLSICGKWLFTIQRTCPPGLMKNNWRPNWQGLNVMRVYDVTKTYEGLSGVPSFGGKDEKREEFKGVYWLATPVASGGRLFAVGQQDGEYKIFCFDQKSLRLLWRTMIAGTSQENTGRRNYYDLNRRPPVGAVVAAGAGKVYWASQNGAVACLDAVRGEKVWVARYWSRRHKYDMKSKWRQPAGNDWHLTPPILVGGRLVMAARDSHEVVCYDAATGTVMWKVPQHMMRGIAGVRGNSVYVYGDRLREIDLVGGKIIRASKTFPTGKATARPVLGAEEIYIPTANGLLVLNLDTFEQARMHDMGALFPVDASGERKRSPALGNLVLCRDVLISAHWQGVSVFYSANLKQRLIDEASAAIAKAPEDFGTRLDRADLYQDFGQHEKALDDAEAAHGLARKRRERYKAQLRIKSYAYSIYQRTRDPKYLVRALKVVRMPSRARLSLSYQLANDHHARKQYKQALDILLELKHKFRERPDIVVELEEGRGVRLDLLLERQLPELRRHVPGDPAELAKLVAQVAKLKHAGELEPLLGKADFDLPTAELELLHAIWTERALVEKGRVPTAALDRYRRLIRVHPKTSAALGALERLVRYYQREEMTGRALRYLAQIQAGYAEVAMPAGDLAGWIARWKKSPKKAPKKAPKEGSGSGSSTDAPPKEGDQDGEGDGSEATPKARWRARTGAELLASFRMPTAVAVPSCGVALAPVLILPFGGRPLPTIDREPARRAGWPLKISRTHTLTKTKSGLSAEPVDYARAQVIGEVPGLNAVVIWVGDTQKRQIELRQVDDWKYPYWRSVSRTQNRTTVSTRRHYGYQQRGKLLRSMPGPTAHVCGPYLLVLDGFTLQALHIEEGRLKWEKELPVDKPHGHKPPNPRRPMLNPPHAPRILTTEDRAFVLTPGGTIFGYEANTGEIAWTTKRTPIQQHREGRLYAIDDQLIVLARVGGEGKAGKVEIHRWDEIGGRRLSKNTLEGQLVDLPDRLASGGTLVLATSQVVRGVDPIGGGDRWKLDIDGINTVNVLPDGSVCVGSSGAFHLLDGRSGRLLLMGQMGEAGELVTQARRVGDYFYVLGQPGRERNSYQVEMWLGAYRISQRKRIWESDFKTSYYPFYHHLLGLEGGACVVSSYSMQANRSTSQVFKDGKSQRSWNIGSTNANRWVGPLSARKPHAYNGYLFIPATSGIETFSKDGK